MFKSTCAFASLALLFSFQASQAQTTPPMTMPMTCTDDDMAKLQTAMEGMSDTPKKDMAMKEMNMAKDKMSQKNNDGCMMHMQNVQKAMQ
jgi:hypothetical protein